MSAVSYRRASCVAPHLLHIRATIFRADHFPRPPVVEAGERLTHHRDAVQRWPHDAQ
jgi:hypothetical protein